MNLQAREEMSRERLRYLEAMVGGFYFESLVMGSVTF